MDLDLHAGLAPLAQGLYDPAREHDACGVGFVAHIKGRKSHLIVEQGLTVLKNLTHRGAVGWDPKLSDGAGCLIQLPDRFFREELARQDVHLPASGQYGVGMVFLPRDPASRLACEYEIERAIKDEGQVLLGWRDVPVDNSDLAEPARKLEPVVRQVFVGRGAGVTVTDALERKLYIIRKSSGHAIQALKLAHGKEFYVPSFSARSVCYKGMLLAYQVGEYYLDLKDPRVESALALVHQRFSTNTFPSWDLAHPFRMICHNGEINTLRGNVNWIRARQGAISSPILGADLAKIWPLIYDGQSDSASFDNALELLVMGGYSVAHAMMLMIPEAWENHTLMDPSRRAFYEYHAAMMEPWDGPASIAFTDGRQIGATLDRNGLRPSRYIVTDDDLVIMGSECGCLPVPEERIVKKWRLQPGKMFLVDLEKGRIIDDKELKDSLASAKPYAEWIERIRVKLDDVDTEQTPPLRSAVPLLDRQQAFAYTQEDLRIIMEPIAANGEEPIGSMGNDSPLAVLSSKDKTLSHYFKQLFAQVTNPAIDPIREELVTSLVSFIGPKPNLLGIDEMNPPLRLEVSQPVLDFYEMEKIRHIDRYTGGKFRSFELDITYPVAWGKEAIEARLASLAAQAEDAVRAGYSIIVLSDRLLDAEHVAIPALLALSAIHQHLVGRGLRTSSGLVVETGSAREVHHFALLGGYGAEAVHPYLALETLLGMHEDRAAGSKAIKNFVKAIGKGLKKVMSKMGISTYMSYTGSQCFEAIGLAKSLTEKYFSGTASNIEGIGLFDVAEEAIRIHKAAFGTDPVLATALDAGGEYAFRVRGEEHMWTPDAIAKLQQATRANSWKTYKEYAELVNEQALRHMTFRGLFAFRFDRCTPVPLEEVEPAAEIVKRFSTGAMSLGSISTEAHTTLAIAMNRIGGRSNTGEGGEDRKRYAPIRAGESLMSRLGRDRVEVDIPLQEGDSLNSKIKQVASGRFGVTAEYLVNAKMLQIKIAQGAKPGEGGQLPGRKVSEYIAELRYATPGVELISPPPHHDIYSIEDIAQLIHDLKNANPEGDVSVKLVSEIGVGTIAAGVAKAKSDHVTIAGHDGGTGASPWSSIKHAGTPWELGLAETQQTLVLNRLRGRIAVQVDGQIKTGRDVAIGAILGADEFGFATAPLVVEGCIMMRKCHLNTCPVGVATQDPVLRRKFEGKPEHVVNYFFFVAEEARELMAKLGIRKLDELIGRTDLLDTSRGIEHWKAKGLDFSRIFHMPKMPPEVALYRREKQQHGLEKALDNRLIELARPALERGEKVAVDMPIRNINRTFGTMLSSRIAKRYGHEGLPDGTIQVRLAGSAGQSFGAFLARGVTLELIGDTNDYCGKGLSGGRIAVQPSPKFRGEPTENIITGNVVLYGAIAGEAYFRGVAGERFAVRNSGAWAVVEGVGDHGCEYMTGGTVAVLGVTGRNFAAGMSGGIAYVFDADGEFARRCNQSMVDLEPLLTEVEQQAKVSRDFWHLGQSDEALLRSLVENHAKYTGSRRAQQILADWAAYRGRFVKIFPKEYRRALGELAAAHKRAAA
ncbi:MAG TPA: glutamate synthase-related protein [Burkholderiales bacterium]|nr:glutamate synthase-related protein [Burkholderiales bacterium]